MEEQEKERASVNIAGTKYFVDLVTESLIPEDKTLKPIHLMDFEVSMADDWIYLGYYDLDKRESVTFPEDIRTLPEGKIVQIILPSYRELDPPTWFKLHGERLNVTREIIEGLPVHNEALIVPLDKSDLALLVEENNIKLGSELPLKEKIENSDQTQRELPEIIIKGTAFLVDVLKEELRELRNEENVIAFSDMFYQEPYYLMNYDPDTKNMVLNSDNVILDYRVDQMVNLDPEGMALKTGKTVAEIQGKTDFELLIDQEVLQKRLEGRLPEIDICGHPFYVDLNMGCVRPKDDFSTEGIRFKDIAYEDTPDGKHYEFAYDPAKHEPVMLNLHEITEIPKELVLIKIPTEPYLDPVSYARSWGLDMRQALMQYKIQEHMIAKVIPWQDTEIEELISENKARKNKENEKPEQNKKTRMKRGKGI